MLGGSVIATTLPIGAEFYAFNILMDHGLPEPKSFIIAKSG